MAQLDIAVWVSSGRHLCMKRMQCVVATGAMETQSCENKFNAIIIQFEQLRVK